MNRQLNLARTALSFGIRRMVQGPQILAFLPALVLAGYWVEDELILTLTVIGLPVVLAVFAVSFSIRELTKRNSNTSRESQSADFDLAIDRAIMALEHTQDWIEAYLANILDPPEIRSKSG